MLPESDFDLSEFDAKPSHFHLRIKPAEELDVSRGPDTQMTFRPFCTSGRQVRSRRDQGEIVPP